jgi:16S rRNA (adenine1518-N6/adenine1519-N6)-dimethyltransferase
MASIRTELAEYGIIPKKRLGQHFLVDRNVLNKVLRAARIEKEDVVLEIGPGMGGMTFALAGQAKRVIAVEIDPKLAEILHHKMGDISNVEVIRKDILEVDFQELYEREKQRMKVVANLPYQISTPLLFRFIELKEIFSTLTLMLQKEVAERMAAPPGGKAYGPLSIFIQLAADLSLPFFIKPSCFAPPPRVDSAVVHLTWKKEPLVGAQNEAWFKRVVRGCFCYRRKTLMNALRHSGLSLPADTGERVKNIGINFQRRPETLSIQEFARLADTLKN